MRKIFTFLFAALMSVSMYATTVTWDNNDITGSGNSFTKDGVTITAGAINFNQKNFEGGGTFTTTLGNFTKIEVTTGYFGASGTGWSGSRQSGTWTGNASSVSFSGDITGMSMGNTKFVFTIEDSAPQPVVNLKAIEFQVPASWENDTTYITAEDFPGFVATTYDIAKTLSVPSDILIVFVYDFPGNDESSLFMKYGGEVIEESTTAKYARGAFFNIAQSVHIYYPVLDEPAPATYTLQLVADPEKGSVAVTNLLGSDIIDNGNGNYTVPANAEVTILATPLEGYEFSGWKEGNIEEMVGCYYCGTALNTEDNPYTFTMTADVAYLAEFEAAAPQPQMDETVIYVAFPSANRPEKIEVAGTFEAGAWGMRVFNGDWYTCNEDLYTSAEDILKFRDADNHDIVLCQRIPANGEGEDKWVQLLLKCSDFEVVSWKGEMVRVIDEQNFFDATNYAWMTGMPEPDPTEGIENVILTEKAKKVVVDGMIYIVRDGKLFNLTGAQVR